MTQFLDDLLAEFTKRCGPCCVAGGAARDVLMGCEPKDYDVFCFTDVKSEQFAGLEALTTLPFHKSETFLQGTFRWRDRFVQVMRPEVNDVASLLETFDWNVSLFAYDGEFKRLESPDNIGRGKPLWLKTVTFPLSTLRRGFRFSERFQMEFKQEDIKRLCRTVAKVGEAETTL